MNLSKALDPTRPTTANSNSADGLGAIIDVQGFSHAPAAHFVAAHAANPKQPLVLSDVVSQIVAGNRSITGVMIESNLEAGNQPIAADRSKMTYGCSVTDGCVDWAGTEAMLLEAATRLRAVL